MLPQWSCASWHSRVLGPALMCNLHVFNYGWAAGCHHSLSCPCCRHFRLCARLDCLIFCPFFCSNLLPSDNVGLNVYGLESWIVPLLRATSFFLKGSANGLFWSKWKCFCSTVHFVSASLRNPHKQSNYIFGLVASMLFFTSLYADIVVPRFCVRRHKWLPLSIVKSCLLHLL